MARLGTGLTLAAAGIGAIAAGRLIFGGKPKRRRRRRPAGADPWDGEVLADLAELASFPTEDDPPVQLEPGQRFWLKIDEAKVGSRAKLPTIGSVGENNLPRPPCLEVETEVRRGNVRYVPLRATSASFCTVFVGYDTLPSKPGAEAWLGFRVRIEPPLSVGRDGVDELAAARSFGGQPAGAHVVCRPGQHVRLDCTGHDFGGVTVVLPRGEYETRVRAERGAQCMLVDLDERELETVASWVVTAGGRLVLEHLRIATGEILACGVVAVGPEEAG